MDKIGRQPDEIVNDLNLFVKVKLNLSKKSLLLMIHLKKRWAKSHESTRGYSTELMSGILGLLLEQRYLLVIITCISKS